MQHEKFRKKLSKVLSEGARALECRSAVKTIARMPVDALEDANWAEAYRYLSKWLVKQDFNING